METSSFKVCILHSIWLFLTYVFKFLCELCSLSKQFIKRQKDVNSSNNRGHKPMKNWNIEFTEEEPELPKFFGSYSHTLIHHIFWNTFRLE